MDELTEHLAAIRRMRMERLQELMRDLEAGRPLGSGAKVSKAVSNDTATSSEKVPEHTSSSTSREGARPRTYLEEILERKRTSPTRLFKRQMLRNR